MTTELNFQLKKNTDFTLTFTVTDADGSAVAITSASIKWVVKEFDNEDAANLITKTVGSGITITSGAGGVFTVEIENTDTADLAVGEYIHEATVTLASGRIITLTDTDGDAGVLSLRPQYSTP